jgi:hypothetical protein
MSKNRQSFMSEHTAEFYLVPRFITVLNTRFSSVLPFFFWSTREGNATSRRAFLPDPVRVCALFPRRPKLGDTGNVLMKVNLELFDLASGLSEAGIPVFAGIPLVSSLVELAQAFECNWYCLTASENPCADLEVECDGGVEIRNGTLRGPLRQNEVVEIVEARSQPTTWQDMLQTLRSVRNREVLGRYHFPFGPVYKPVYFTFW